MPFGFTYPHTGIQDEKSHDGGCQLNNSGFIDLTMSAFTFRSWNVRIWAVTKVVRYTGIRATEFRKEDKTAILDKYEENTQMIQM